MKIKPFFYSLTLFLVGCGSDPDSVPLSEIDHCDSIQQHQVKPLSHYIEPFQSKLDNKTGVYVLEQGAEAMMSRAWITDRAERSIDIQYFIFSVDNIGLIATDHLVRAAERGVKVRVLIDDIMLDAKGDELLMLDAHENIEIKIYNPNVNIGKNIIDKLGTLLTDFHGLNQRMHNKVFLVDDQIAVTGGRNIADEYFGFDHEYNFRDRDVFLAGKAVSDVKRSFNEFWNHELSVGVEKLVGNNPYPKNPDFSRLHSYSCNPENFHPEIKAEIEKVPQTFDRLMDQGRFRFLEKVEYISDKPGKNDQQSFLGGGSITRSTLIELAESAEKSILIQTPYLVTTKADRKFLRQLVDKGVEIKILTNSLASNDNLEAFSGYQRNRSALLKTGVEIYEFKPDAKVRQRVMTEHMFKRLPTTPIFGLHAKTMTIDEHITIVGTYNFDPRSANLNTESFTVIHSPEITDGVNIALRIEMEPENAWLISEDFNPDHKVSIFKQIGVKIRRIVPKNIL
ncbi:phospholipase D family protein [Vibrio europaeus]|uniref:Cardiolipin synthase n=1 Tax=Vibrio europaeus TaxID=300876 RepID=A0A178JBD3_9VIBR|nr:phospholipase D family protein [Vibrio europaeus]MDC5703287.1 phospholipase D family protein [Vibrio europaeus]MDC5711558.1 phospholipase D family protein [Vibrio europaeus]MDC5715051.1 phospholipase D family protein [Vibrio europaeus]MDC5722011.1 phospholipase D family protein [Vibrio europaeus]MDC5727669.1 phospholipase D family protein [Vibrio europaeus]